MTERANSKEVTLICNRRLFVVSCSVLSGYGRSCLDNELDMELDDDEEEMDGFTEDRLAPPPPVVFFIYMTGLFIVAHFNEIHKNLHQYFLLLVAGSPELCACECPQRTHLGQSIYRLLLFFCLIYSF